MKPRNTPQTIVPLTHRICEFLKQECQSLKAIHEHVGGDYTMVMDTLYRLSRKGCVASFTCPECRSTNIYRFVRMPKANGRPRTKVAAAVAAAKGYGG